MVLPFWHSDWCGASLVPDRQTIDVGNPEGLRGLAWDSSAGVTRVEAAGTHEGSASEVSDFEFDRLVREQLMDCHSQRVGAAQKLNRLSVAHEGKPARIAEACCAVSKCTADYTLRVQKRTSQTCCKPNTMVKRLAPEDVWSPEDDVKLQSTTTQIAFTAGNEHALPTSAFSITPVPTLSLTARRETIPLLISILSATGLHKADMLGKLDPYCTIELQNGNVLARTTVKRQTLNPEWNEDLAIEEYVIGQTIVFKVWDKQMVGSPSSKSRFVGVRKEDDFLGVAAVCSNFFLPGGSGALDLHLEVGCAGRATLRVKITPQVTPDAVAGMTSETVRIDEETQLQERLLQEEQQHADESLARSLQQLEDGHPPLRDGTVGARDNFAAGHGSAVLSFLGVPVLAVSSQDTLGPSGNAEIDEEAQRQERLRKEEQQHLDEGLARSLQQLEEGDPALTDGALSARGNSAPDNGSAVLSVLGVPVCAVSG